MRKGLLIIWLLGFLHSGVAYGQSIHFSQYYNAPLLLNAANTALMPEDDMRIGLNYRNQWSALPVPFNTFSAWADFKIGSNASEERHNWLGLGFAFFSDKAGDGNLSLNQAQGNLAYHLHMGQTAMLSLGLSGAYVQRAVNYDNLTFDMQWDGHVFNTNLANGEKVGIMKTSYYTVAAGANLAWFPNEAVYCKLGGVVANINTPEESFYNGPNRIAMRPMMNLDVLIRTSNIVIINPSVYYSMQKGAAELVAGSQVRTLLSDNGDIPKQLILGLYMRVNDAFIGVAGMEIGNVQIMANYDMTMSSLAPYNASYGALELSLIYHRPYLKNYGIKSMYSCPRF
jgi:type IX secretion system PorP/SprF family membrane protein